MTVLELEWRAETAFHQQSGSSLPSISPKSSQIKASIMKAVMKENDLFAKKGSGEPFHPPFYSNAFSGGAKQVQSKTPLADLSALWSRRFIPANPPEQQGSQSSSFRMVSKRDFMRMFLAMS